MEIIFMQSTPDCFMAVDLGTSYIKVGIYDLFGHEISCSREAVSSFQPAPAQFIQRGEDILKTTVLCMKKCASLLSAEMKKGLLAISFTGQMAGFMGVDKDWNDITGWSCSLDTRYAPYAQRQLQVFGDDFYLISGTNSPLFAAKAEWFRTEFSEESKKIRKYLMISGYIIGKLGDLPIKDAIIDSSLITWTGLADVSRRSWSKKICREIGIEPDTLPRIVNSTDIIAHLSTLYAHQIGLPSGIPIVAGAGDKICGCTGAGCLSPGELLCELASFSAISTAVPEVRYDPRRGYDLLDGSEPDLYYCHYYIPGSGITKEWFINHFYREKNESLKEAYRRMENELSDIPPGSDRLMAIGMMDGTVMPLNTDLRGAFMGLSWNHTSAHLYHALLESYGYAFASAVARINALYPEYSTRSQIKAIGGGSASPAALQILADCLGIPVSTINIKNPSMYGACLLAAKGIGLIHSLDEVQESCVKNMQTFDPRPENTEFYKRMCDQYTDNEKIMTTVCNNLSRY